MLSNIRIKAGEFTQVTRKANHINVVLAGGTITARIEYENGQVFQTDMVAGMALALETFSRVSFSAENDQQCKIWISTMPLTYSPDTLRPVGSSNFVSSVGKVYSGRVEPLLPAEVGRNKVVISPSNDILIGGAGLNAQNGIPVTAGSVFEFNTQGEVNALEITGSFPAEITADVTLDDIQTPEQISNQTAYYSFFNPHDGLIWINDNRGRTFDLYDPITLQFVGGETVSASGDYGHSKLIKDGDILYLPAQQFSTNNVQTVTSYNIKTKQVIANNVPVMGVTNNPSEIAAYNGRLHFVHIDDNGAVSKYGYSDDNGLTWTDKGSITGVTLGSGADGQFRIDIASNGDVFIADNGGLLKSTDEGDTWTRVTTQVLNQQLKISKVSGEMFAEGQDDDVYISQNGGATWTKLIITTNGFCGDIDVKGDKMVVNTNQDIYYYRQVDDLPVNGVISQQVLFTNAGTNPLGANILDNGMLLFGNSGGNVNIVRGKVELGGGLDVALLSEVN
jgi:hypothetical protein